MSIYFGHDGAEDLASALGYPTHHVDEERHAEDHDYGAQYSTHLLQLIVHGQHRDAEDEPAS
jgi:hypothetical protein